MTHTHRYCSPVLQTAQLLCIASCIATPCYASRRGSAAASVPSRPACSVWANTCSILPANSHDHSCEHCHCAQRFIPHILANILQCSRSAAAHQAAPCRAAVPYLPSGGPAPCCWPAFRGTFGVFRPHQREMLVYCRSGQRLGCGHRHQVPHFAKQLRQPAPSTKLPAEMVQMRAQFTGGVRRC